MTGPGDGDRATYAKAGVDIDAGDELVERIKPLARRTMRPEVLGGIGGFASLVGLPARYQNPVLVSGTDGVGTKLAVAFLTGRHDTVGIDLVAMCVNDVAVTGAEPLFFLDYFATGKLSVAVAESVISGIAEGCRQAGCALVGGETAELPGFYQAGEYDLAGFCVGVVERDGTWDGSRIQPGDRVLGLLSSGLHSNGYSLTRNIVFDRAKLALDAKASDGRTWSDVLMTPTRIYVRALRALADAGVAVGGAAHITGGGLPGNAPRCLPAGTSIVLRRGSWPIPPVFTELERLGNVEEAEMLRTYNMGLGMIVVVRPADVARAKELLAGAGESVHEVGEVIATPGREPEATLT